MPLLVNHMTRSMTAKQLLAAQIMALTLLFAAGGAQAKGCIKGAAVGAVAGHVAGRHAKSPSDRQKMAGPFLCHLRQEATICQAG